MDITHYSFAFFVFVLLCALILINARVSRGKRKDDTGSFEKEQRLFRLYQNIEDMMAGFEEYAEEAKSEIARGLEQLNAHALVSEPGSAIVNAASDEIIAPEPEKTAKSKTSAKKEALEMKPEDRIPLLVKKGMSKSEIAKELGLSIREVTLIMDIKKITFPDDKA